MKTFEAILFDFDGVLVDSEPVHFACWTEVLEPLGVRLDWETYARHCIGVNDRSMIEFLATLCDPPRDPELLWDQYPAKKERYRARVNAHPPFSKGISEFVKSLNGYRLAVVSSSARSEVEPLIEAAGLRPCFAALVCGEDVVRHKPAPDPYLLAADLLGVSSALVVEDSDAGLASARAAGFEAVRITHPDLTAQLVRDRLNGGAVGR